MANGNGGGVQIPTRGGRVPMPGMPEALTGMNQGSAGAMFAYVLEKKIGGRPWDWFQYSAQWLPLTASATLVRTIQIDADADFLALACVGTARAVAAPAAQNTDRPFLISMRASGTGANVFDEATDFEMVVGTAQRPAWWGLPRLMALGSTYVLTLQNLAAADVNVRVGFWGIKVYAT